MYWSVDTGDGVVEDVVWSEPRVEQVAGLMAFWAAGVTLNGQTG